MKYHLIIGKSIDGKKTEYQVSDGVIGKRSISFDYQCIDKAKKMLNILNKREVK